MTELETMAHLNVHERRIEAKIAYVGPELAGKATNLARLRLDAGARPDAAGDDTLALDWKPRGEPTFRDCDVMVKVVAQRGAFGEGQDVLRDADGVVLVVDATPDARERNRVALAAIKEALAAVPSRSIPVVVQVNKSDVEGALAPSAIAASLETGAWPHVSASAARGEGVVETLDRAIEEVLRAMRAEDDTQGEPGSGEGPVARRSEGNPLLTALKTVLTDTVTRHVGELEGRQAERLAAELDRRFAHLASEIAARTAAPTPSVTEDGLRKILASHADAIRSVVDGHRAETLAAIQNVEKQVAELRRAGEATPTEDPRAEETKASLGRIEFALDEVATSLVAAQQARTSDGDRSERLRVDLEALRRDIKRELGKVQEASTRADRDAATAIQGLSAAVGTATRAGQEGTERIGALEKTVRVEAVTATLARVAAMEKAMQSAAGDTAASLHQVDARVAEIQERFTELIEELKKRKKGWFGG